jgi:hypothetical protein
MKTLRCALHPPPHSGLFIHHKELDKSKLFAHSVYLQPAVISNQQRSTTHASPCPGTVGAIYHFIMVLSRIFSKFFKSTKLS